MMKYNAGLFSATDKEISQFSRGVINCLKNSDFVSLVLWRRREYKVVSYAKNAKYIDNNVIANDIFYNSDSWLKALNGKTVLVVSPFAKTIEKQYKTKASLLFNNKNILPEFNLKTIKAVQGLDTKNAIKQYGTWTNSLEIMKKEIKSIDFDIAIIGAGAFAPFLADSIKNMGKQAISLCGNTQLLFGIKGARWDNSSLYNEYWVSPSKEEIPADLSNFLVNEHNIASYF